MKLDELRNKIDKHALTGFAIFIVLLLGMFLSEVTIIGSIILIVLAFIAFTINSWLMWKAKRQYNSELFKHIKEIWKLLKRKEPPLE